MLTFGMRYFLTTKSACARISEWATEGVRLLLDRDFDQIQQEIDGLQIVPLLRTARKLGLRLVYCIERNDDVAEEIVVHLVPF